MDGHTLQPTALQNEACLEGEGRRVSFTDLEVQTKDANVDVPFMALIIVAWQARLVISQKQRAEAAKAFAMSMLLDSRSY